MNKYDREKSKVQKDYIIETRRRQEIEQEENIDKEKYLKLKEKLKMK